MSFHTCNPIRTPSPNTTKQSWLVPSPPSCHCRRRQSPQWHRSRLWPRQQSATNVSRSTVVHPASAAKVLAPLSREAVVKRTPTPVKTITLGEKENYSTTKNWGQFSSCSSIIYETRNEHFYFTKSNRYPCHSPKPSGLANLVFVWHTVEIPNFNVLGLIWMDLTGLALRYTLVQQSNTPTNQRRFTEEKHNNKKVFFFK